jgi:hypothetical protein
MNIIENYLNEIKLSNPKVIELTNKKDIDEAIKLLDKTFYNSHYVYKNSFIIGILNEKDKVIAATNILYTPKLNEVYLNGLVVISKYRGNNLSLKIIQYIQSKYKSILAITMEKNTVGFPISHPSMAKILKKTGFKIDNNYKTNNKPINYYRRFKDDIVFTIWHWKR